MSQNVNLLNPALLPRRDALGSRNLLIGVGVLLLLVVAAFAWSHAVVAGLQRRATRGQVALKQAQAQLADLTHSVAQHKPDPKLAAELVQAKAELSARGKLEHVLASGAAGDTAGFSQTMRAFARQSMQGLWLTGFTIGARHDDLEIRGDALSAELLPTYIRRLNREPVFQGRSFATVSIKAVGATSTDASAPGAQAKDVAAVSLPAHVEFTLSSFGKARAQ